MVPSTQAPKLKAVTNRLVLACLAVLAPAVPLSLQAEDLILQPGIVEEIPPPWQGNWELFTWTDAPSKLRASASFSGIWNDNIFITADSPIEDFLWDTNLALWFESSAAEESSPQLPQRRLRPTDPDLQ